MTKLAIGEAIIQDIRELRIIKEGDDNIISLKKMLTPYRLICFSFLLIMSSIGENQPAIDIGRCLARSSNNTCYNIFKSLLYKVRMRQGRTEQILSVVGIISSSLVA